MNVWFALLAFGAQADEGVPEAAQVVVFKKIFDFDRTLAAKPFRVLVVSEAANDPVVEAFDRQAVPATLTKPAALEGVVGPDVVVYVAAALSATNKALCASRGALTISGDPGLALAGEVSVALRKKADGKAEILVNLKRLKEERHDLAAALLNLATTVK